MATLGIDFGTSNSAAGYVRDGAPHLVMMAPGQTTLPTTVFFDYDARKMLMGHPANAALLDGVEGRFMRALKRVLGTSIMHEKRQLLNERVTFVDIIARFLAEVKRRAEAEAGHVFDHALSGRPVVFHGSGDPREAQAEADLRACYLAAGFADVSFLPEPEAAAIASGALDHPGAIGLIVDIGGGTSDFSVFRARDGGVEILSNHGVRIGGTDFDRSISIDRVMPLLGAGTLIRNAIGPGTLPAPKAIFNDLATWEKIPFLYTAQTRRMVADMVQMAEDRDRMARLGAVLENELGHDVAFAVEQGKIDANSGRTDAVIALGEVARGLKAALPCDALRGILDPHAAALRKGVAETLEMAQVGADRVDQVIYVGGSSLMAMVTDTMKVCFPGARHSFSEVFTAVADGLALAAGARDAG
ncbi:Hsp70 family protein [Tateyamaria omphalii]|uniref:Hsp70 family protein n=1 Tax=Tateyamaria omphalii TaxID=299262 RepID=A0A1P8MY12_9RHOB|nr:Hsp70 family protein [Tateyamaria omphalii]APX12872.1 hsp70 family protein [Tateyamaria omphalii]